MLFSGGISLYTSQCLAEMSKRDAVFGLYFILYFSIVGESNAKDGMLFTGGILFYTWRVKH